MNHKINCNCGVCKAIRGEYKGKNSPSYKGNKAIRKQNYFCIEKNCNKSISYNTFLYKTKKCSEHARKSRVLGWKRPDFSLIMTGINHYNWKNGKSKKQYFCIEKDCNNTISISNFYYGKKNCKSCSKKGKNNPSWNNGISFIEYPKEFNNKFKEKIRKRDNYTCVICNKLEKDLQTYQKKLYVHHIDYNKINNNLNNLLSLCGSCHQKTNFQREKWQEYFKELFKKRGLYKHA